jgi:hypothetical protein
MSAGFRIFWLTALCFFVTGCASRYRPANLPRTGDLGDVEHDSRKDTVKPGDRVRVTLVDGSEISGFFVSRDLTSLTIGYGEPTTNEGEPNYSDFASEIDNELVLPFTEIATIERYHEDKQGAAVAAMAIALGIGVAVFAAVAFGEALKESLDWDLGMDEWQLY